MVHHIIGAQLCQYFFFAIIGKMKSIFNADEHIYIQLADLLRTQIYHKQLEERVPGIRELAEEYSINAKTVNKAITLLIDEGLLYRIRGKGTFVTDTNTHPNRTTLCGFVLPNITNPNFALYAQVLEEEGFQNNISFIVNVTGNNHGRLFQIMNTYKNRGVSAVIIQEGAVHQTGLLEDITEMNIPIIGLHTHADFIDDVWPDVRAGAQLATDHLIENFESSVGYISGSDDPVKLTGRFRGYRDSHLAHGLEVDLRFVTKEKPGFRGGYNAVKKLIEQDSIPRTILFYNQLMAMGGISALFERGYKIPEDVAVVGIDDSVDVDQMLIPTSTINFPYDETARQLIHLVKRRINNDKGEPQSIRIAPRLIVRDSSRA